MQELVPVVIGIAIGIAAGPRPSRRAAVAAGALALVAGLVVAWVFGELARSVGYAIFDAGVVAATTALAVTAQRLAVGMRDHQTREEVRRG